VGFWGDFLLAVGVMCGLTGLLAALLVAAEAFIAHVGEVRLTIDGGRTLTVEGGRSLLATLKEQRLFIPSACGGRGSCGLCKLRVLEGGGDPLPTELPWLSAAERSRGVRLACQVRVRGDLRLAIPEELLGVREYTAVVSALRDLTYDIKEVRLRLVDPPEIRFVAGQYVQFEVPAYALTPEPVYRAYSVASDPCSAGEIELEIRLVPNGICTTYVHKHLKVGERVRINGPYGEFRLHESDRPILFVAGGSGMAPIKAILADMRRARCPRQTVYFFGARSARDLFLVDAMRALERELPAFRFVPALSAPQPGDGWTGETGLITEVVDRHVADASGMEAYLCGSPLMIDACIAVLRARGMPPDRIFYDKFA
jgi:Na+-transporting NADH:ubiquinone oxidoreductase subunit F